MIWMATVSTPRAGRRASGRQADYEVAVDLEEIRRGEIKGGPFPFAEKDVRLTCLLAWQEIAKFGKKKWWPPALQALVFGNIQHASR